MLIVLEFVKISGMGYASDICLVGKRSTFSKYTQSPLMHNPCFCSSVVAFVIVFRLTGALFQLGWAIGQRALLA